MILISSSGENSIGVVLKINELSYKIFANQFNLIIKSCASIQQIIRCHYAIQHIWSKEKLSLYINIKKKTDKLMLIHFILHK